MTRLAQATIPGSDASNAADFQPPTQNPQSAQGQLFPSGTNLQNPQTEELLQQKDARIAVPNNPGSADPPAAEAKSGGWGIGLALVLAICFLLCLRWLIARKRNQYKPLELVTDAQPVATPSLALPTPKKSQTTPHKKRKKSKSLRKKR